MNQWQIAYQIHYQLTEATWTDGAQSKVFCGGYVSDRPVQRALGTIPTPFFRVNIGPTVPNAERPDLLEDAQFEVQIVTSVAGDRYGQHAIMGAHRSGQGRSTGRGLMEVEEEMLSAIQMMTGADGVNIRNVAKSAQAAATVEDLGPVATRSYAFSALCTTFRHYHAPYNLALSSTTLSWSLPPDRFDRYRIIIRESATSTPPSSPTAGTAVTLSSNLATSVDVGSGSGRSWSAWCEYDEVTGKRDGAPDGFERYSSAETGSTLVE